MAYLTKQQYDYRRESAANRMEKNKDACNTLTEEQHEALARLCSARHDFHSNIDTCVKGEDSTYTDELINANADLVASGLPAIKGVPASFEDYIDIDTIALLYQLGGIPEDDEEREEWYSTEYERIYGEYEDLNTVIEDYLREIDKTHGTHYAPTGALRVF